MYSFTLLPTLLYVCILIRYYQKNDPIKLYPNRESNPHYFAVALTTNETNTNEVVTETIIN